jgi:uncharacterized membrane protein YccF (DUF307 family)
MVTPVSIAVAVMVDVVSPVTVLGIPVKVSVFPETLAVTPAGRFVIDSETGDPESAAADYWMGEG